MRYLVTGGAGFIGSHLIESLIKRSDQVVVLDNLSTGSSKNLSKVADKITIHNGSILDQQLVDKLVADLANAVLSLPASKGFDIGSGFDGTLLTGFEHNDEFYIDENGEIRTVTNRSGGIQGGISNGENIIIRVAFKPTATIRKEQRTVTKEGEETLLSGKGRHDPCVLPRAVPMVDAMVALVLCDHLLRHYGQCKVL